MPVLFLGVTFSSEREGSFVYREGSLGSQESSFLILNLLAKEGMSKCSLGTEGEAHSSFGLSLVGVSYKQVQVEGCFPSLCALRWATPMHPLWAHSLLSALGVGMQGCLGQALPFSPCPSLPKAQSQQSCGGSSWALTSLDAGMSDVYTFRASLRAGQYLCGSLWAKPLELFLLFFRPCSWDVAVGKRIARNPTCAPCSLPMHL